MHAKMFPRPILLTSLFHRHRHSVFSGSHSYLQTLQKRFAGHSKWSKIKRSKGAKDANKAGQFAKATLAIRVASKACAGDMANLHLQSSVQAAKAMQVPKDRIEDAIKCVSKGTDEELVNMRYDGYLNTPSGRVQVILTALTDNKNRTAANVRSKLSKSDGELSSTGVNDWLFDHVGVALVHKQKGIESDDDQSASKFTELTEREEEEILECALEGGAADVDFGEPEDEHALVKCDPSDLHPLVVTLREGGYHVSEFEVRYMMKDASSSIMLDIESTEKFQQYLDKMDSDEDVNNVFHNATLSDNED